MKDPKDKKTPSEAIQVRCPVCGHTEIVYIPKETIPVCPKCKKPMLVKEVLTEGKSY